IGMYSRETPCDSVGGQGASMLGRGRHERASTRRGNQLDEFNGLQACRRGSMLESSQQRARPWGRMGSPEGERGRANPDTSQKNKEGFISFVFYHVLLKGSFVKMYVEQSPKRLI